MNRSFCHINKIEIGKPQTLPMICIFSIFLCYHHLFEVKMVETNTLVFYTIMVADYSFEFISIVHWVLKFITHNKSILGGVTPWKIGQCIMVRTDERWVLCYICMCKSIEGQSQIKIPSINLIRDQFSMNWASRNDYQASHIFFLSFFLQGKRL